MKNFVIYLTTLSMILLLGKCAERKRMNPLDPQNPNTKGAPQNFSIHSQKNIVTLNWDEFLVNNMEKYYIYRAIDDSTQLSKYDSISANYHVYTDTVEKYYHNYFYSIQAKTDFETSNKSKIARVLPGQNNILIADYSRRYIFEMSFDTGKLISFLPQILISSMTKLNDNVYLTDYYGQSLLTLNDTATVNLSQIESVPVELIANQSQSELYVVCTDQTLLTFDTEGSLEETRNLDCEVNFYTNIAYDSVNDYLWITNPDSNEIFYYDFQNSTTNLFTNELTNPDEIAIHERGGCWIASESGLIRIQDQDSISFHLTDLNIYDISRNNHTGDIYYSGANQNVREIGYLTQNAQYNKTIFSNKYYYILKIKCIPEPPGTGLILINDYSGRMYRINASGEEIGKEFYIHSVEDIILK